MTNQLDHRKFVIVRKLAGQPSHAFRFWSEHALKRQWNSCHPDWEVIVDEFDFRTDGRETLVWKMPSGSIQELIAHFLEVADRQRIVYAYVMRTDNRNISSSLVTVEFTEGGNATTMTYTEQAVFPDAATGTAREMGTGAGLDRLVEVLRRSD